MSTSKVQNIKVSFGDRGMCQAVWYNNPNIVEVDNRVFTLSLQYIDYYKGRSAQGFIFKDEDNKEYYMMMKDFDELVKTHSLDRGRTPLLEWVFVKRGSSYGIAEYRRND